VSRGILREIAKDLDILLAQYNGALVILGSGPHRSLTGVFFSILACLTPSWLAALAFPLNSFPCWVPSRPLDYFCWLAASSGIPSHVGRLRGSWALPASSRLRAHPMSAGMGAASALVVFGVFAGEQIAGIPGAFLSVPVMACCG